MSTDFAVWMSREALTPEQARQVYLQISSLATVPEDASDEVRRFYGDVIAVHPDLDTSTPEDEIDDLQLRPWASEIGIGADFLLFSVVAQRADEVRRLLHDVARAHGATLFDPQESRVLYSPHRVVGADLVLESESGPLATNPSRSVLVDTIQHVGKPGYGFVVLAHPSGDFIQCAGKSTRLTVEWREHLDAGAFRHVVIGLDGGSERPKRLKTVAGSIRLQKREVLAAHHAVELFTRFPDGLSPIPDGFVARDVTRRFV